MSNKKLKTTKPIEQNKATQHQPNAEQTKALQWDNKTPKHQIDLATIEQLIGVAKIEVLTEAKEEISKQSQASLGSFVSVFGIFASIMFFFNIEVQFLKTFNTPQEVLGFSLVFFAMLLSFNVTLDYLVTSRLDQKNSKPIPCFLRRLIAISLGIGIALVMIIKIVETGFFWYKF